MRLNKRGMNLALGSIVIFILNVVFFSLLFFSVYRYSNNSVVYEEIYSKKIAITLDNLREGDYVILDISELYDISKKNNYNPFENNLIYLDYNKNEVIVKLSQRSGYSFKVFKNLGSLRVSLNPVSKILIIEGLDND